MIQTAGMVMRGGAKLLADAGIEDATREAGLLMSHALGSQSAGFAAMTAKTLTPQQVSQFEFLVKRRAAREPMAHILGYRDFWSHRFKVTKDTLDPRPDTECLIEVARDGAVPKRILDLGTGTGCIVISLLTEFHAALGVGVDVSEPALAVAQENARDIGVLDRITLMKSDWFSAVEGRFDLIVSNPPYIAETEMAALEPEVRTWEPRGALVAQGDGLAAYQAIASGAMAHLEPGGRVIVEIGSTQSDAVSDLFEQAGFPRPTSFQDLNGHDRVLAWQT